MKKCILKVMIAAMFLVATETSCRKENSKSYLELSSYQLSFGQEGGYQFVTIKASGDVSAISNSTWCATENLSPLKIIVSQNTEADREAEVTVSCGGAEKKIIVSQNAMTPSLSVKETHIVVHENESRDFTLEITANISVVFVLPEWVRKKDNNIPAPGKNTYSFQADAMPKDMKTRTGNLTVKSAYAGFDKSIVVPVTQNNETCIPIMAWQGIPAAESSVGRFVELRGAGITHHLRHYNTLDDCAAAMDMAAKAGVKMLVNCPELKTDPQKIVNRFMNHPAIGGYCVHDEPGRSEFPSLGVLVRKIQAIDNKNLCYINLFPNAAGAQYASKNWLETDTYLEYIQLFIKEVPVPILSFDHYPVRLNATNERVLSEIWYENLEEFSDEARKAGKPFWAFALTTAHPNGTITYPVPTLAELRLQVYSNLAYGAQGIQYFTYWGGSEPWRYGPINYYTKEKTEIYDYIKEINTEIKNLSFVFMNAKVQSIAHTGAIIPMGTQRLYKLPDAIKTFETEGVGAVVSVLQKDGKSYLVVVNRDFKNDMKVKIEGDPDLQRILKDGSIVPAPTNISTITVDPGDVLIYCWKNQ